MADPTAALVDATDDGRADGNGGMNGFTIGVLFYLHYLPIGEMSREGKRHFFSLFFYRAQNHLFRIQNWTNFFMYQALNSKSHSSA